MSHLNTAQIEELKEIMEDSFSDLILTYINDTHTKIDALKIAINTTDSHQVAELAHSLKGSSSNICAESLSALFKKIEDSGRANDLNDVSPTFDKIEQEFQLVKAELQNLQ